MEWKGTMLANALEGVGHPNGQRTCAGEQVFKTCALAMRVNMGPLKQISD
jgi:hypothetical protein